MMPSPPKTCINADPLPIDPDPAFSTARSLRWFPKAWHPYLQLIRLDKPTGTKLMFWPFAWGLTMAAYSQSMALNVYVLRLAECLLGAFIVRSSACTINAIFDYRLIDAPSEEFTPPTERTRSRPIPSGRVPVAAAVVYLLAQYLVGVAFFCATVDGLALRVALFQLLPLFAIYPLMKRVTDWPQAWLGFAMNFGFLTSWISQSGPVNYPFIVAAQMIGCWCWTMLYDTIYACQDKKDDAKARSTALFTAGVRSTALAFGSWIRPILDSGWSMNGHGLAYYLISIGGMAVHLMWQFKTVDLDVPESCWRNFRSNGRLGWIVWGGAFVDYVLKMKYF
ncbi:UbiA prenyltransferase family-domain-containing protein [Lyophyllum atratum]|nr:UbiA prenyltransferase family-domain-containing protein [Lyophyllum atratum]